MKKITAKERLNKIKRKEEIVDPKVVLEEGTREEAHVASELGPEILKVFVKPKKPKNTIDTTDYIPELERGDLDEEFGPSAGGY
jgi:hypothetical protein